MHEPLLGPRKSGTSRKLILIGGNEDIGRMPLHVDEFCMWQAEVDIAGRNELGGRFVDESICITSGQEFRRTQKVLASGDEFSPFHVSRERFRTAWPDNIC